MPRAPKGYRTINGEIIKLAAVVTDRPITCSRSHKRVTQAERKAAQEVGIVQGGPCSMCGKIIAWSATTHDSDVWERHTWMPPRDSKGNIIRDVAAEEKSGIVEESEPLF